MWVTYWKRKTMHNTVIRIWFYYLPVLLIFFISLLHLNELKWTLKIHKLQNDLDPSWVSIAFGELLFTVKLSGDFWAEVDFIVESSFNSECIYLKNYKMLTRHNDGWIISSWIFPCHARCLSFLYFSNFWLSLYYEEFYFFLPIKTWATSCPEIDREFKKRCKRIWNIRVFW